MKPAAKSVQKKSRIPSKTVDANTLISGYGALRGQLMLPNDIDWTQPIYSQVLRRKKPGVSAKRRPSSRKSHGGVAA
jgi:hypothetical protein